MSRTCTAGLEKSTANAQGRIKPGAALELTTPVMEDNERRLNMLKKGEEDTAGLSCAI